MNHTSKSSLTLKSSLISAVAAATAEIRDDFSVSEDLDVWFNRSQTKALLVQKDGEIIYQRYSSDADFGRNVNGLSMAKNIVALLIGIAIDEGKIGSEYDLIAHHIPGYGGRSDRILSQFYLHQSRYR